MTQTEAFLTFKRKYPDVKIGQRVFEECRPFYVIPPSTQDPNSCCCRVHVDSKWLLRAAWILPQNHVCCIHDYSENYSCNYQNEVQSCYYSQTQASIHVTILHRHALNDTDGVGSLPDAPLLVTEHIFVISPDCKHDHHSVHQCRGLIAEYLIEGNRR